jgi:hypothetical protein
MFSGSARTLATWPTGFLSNHMPGFRSLTNTKHRYRNTLWAIQTNERYLPRYNINELQTEKTKALKVTLLKSSIQNLSVTRGRINDILPVPSGCVAEPEPVEQQHFAGAG